jgi:hypothetical protein
MQGVSLAHTPLSNNTALLNTLFPYPHLLLPLPHRTLAPDPPNRLIHDQAGEPQQRLRQRSRRKRTLTWMRKEKTTTRQTRMGKRMGRIKGCIVFVSR